MRRVVPVLAVVLMAATPLAARPFKDVFPQIYAGIPADLKTGIDAMDLRTGMVSINNGMATLDLGKNYYFLGPADSEYVLTKLWENPPSDPPLGMVFPITQSPFHPDAWCFTVEYDPIGFVSDADAKAYDYNALMKDMQDAIRKDSAQRVKDGYSSIELLGWAKPPEYDQATRKLYWAKELRVGGSDENTLNYNIRALGRHGILVLNFIAKTRQLDEIDAALPNILKLVEFAKGNTYADYIPGSDAAAAIGIGGLIAGNVALKTGLFTVAILALKKFGILVVLAAVALFRRLRKLLSGTD